MSDGPERIETAKITRDVAFDITPDAQLREAIARQLDLSALRKLRFVGKIEPFEAKDLELTAKLGATVVQPCVATLEPVVTRIDTDTVRRFVADMPEPTGDEAEMPEDDTQEPLPEFIVLQDVMIEALSLALPDFPRADGAPAVDVRTTEPGIDPMTDDDAKPFAGLKDLRDRLSDNEPEN